MTTFPPRRFPIALDPSPGGTWLYACAVDGCSRLTPGTYCCIWCEYNARFGVKVARHSIGCDGRLERYRLVFRLDRVTPV